MIASRAVESSLRSHRVVSVSLFLLFIIECVSCNENSVSQLDSAKDHSRLSRTVKREFMDVEEMPIHAEVPDESKRFIIECASCNENSVSDSRLSRKVKREFTDVEEMRIHAEVPDESNVRVPYYAGQPTEIECSGGRWLAPNLTQQRTSRYYAIGDKADRLIVVYPRPCEGFVCEKPNGKKIAYLLCKTNCSSMCKNGGKCVLSKPGTSAERADCHCPYQTRGRFCEQKYPSLLWLVGVLWAAVIVEFCFMVSAIYGHLHQNLYFGTGFRCRFVDILNHREPTTGDLTSRTSSLSESEHLSRIPPVGGMEQSTKQNWNAPPEAPTFLTSEMETEASFAEQQSSRL